MGFTARLRLNVGVRLKGDLHRRASSLARHALGFGLRAQFAGSFDGHCGALGGSDFEAQLFVGFLGMEGELRMWKPLPVISTNSSYG